jgi:hypothetical protein
MIGTSRQRFGSLGVLLFLGACAATPTPKAPPATPVAVRSPTILGQEAVLGRDAGTLIGQFGKPNLDVREGSARKLQFSSAVCILDAYLYPRAGGGQPVVTHIDARLPDGRDIDRASCIAALKQGRRSN